jgi:TonB-linked SusC/RagA family outer membrane protein
MGSHVGRIATTWRVGALAVLLALAAPHEADAQQGRITGTVTDAETGAPLGSVQVFVQGTSSGGLTNSSGVYTLENVPVGTHTLIAQRIGYQEARRPGVSVTAGASVSVTIPMSPAVLALQGIVATGLIDPVEGVRAPIAVARVDRTIMPVMASGAPIQSLQGRVPGMTINRGSGQPGSGVSMMLRTPTTLRTDGSSSPLIVVDGVILGGVGTISTTDIEAMDVESIEVIRGAAAASLYGSRAAAGVIAIKTTRGNALPVGETRFTARTEYGASQNMRDLALNNSHAFLMDPTRSFYVDANGNRVDRNRRVLPPLTNAFLDKPFPDGVYDNVAAITRPGNFISNNFGITGNNVSTNFAVTLNNYQEQGSLRENEGYERNSFRVNLDHRFVDALRLSLSMYHSRDYRDNISNATDVTLGTSVLGSQGNPFNDVLRGPRDVDFTTRDENGNYLQQPDPLIAYQNPLWTQTSRENDQWRTRTLANFALNWSPLTWLSASTSVGYDRGDLLHRVYVPKGTPRNVGSAGESDGLIRFRNENRDTWNSEGQVTLRRDFGPLNVRTTGRGIMERDQELSGNRFGNNFVLAGIPQLDNVRAEDRSANSDEWEIRATGYLWDTAFDYDGRYILTVLGRRDGSSLFGPDNRWHNYYRLAGAWRIGEESWFQVPNVDELKISVARGTAGGRPGFNAQYETWALTGGVPTKGALGNTFLAPEHTTENEVSLNAILYNRYGIVLTHARQQTRDQLVQAPLPAFTGYSNQWVNAGVISGHTTEFEIQAQVIQRPNLGFMTMLVADYSNSRIDEWPLPCQTPGWRFNCTGEPVFGIYSWWLVKDRAGLQKHRGGDAWDHRDQFQVNDEGFLVWVGPGNNYWEGMSKNLWGTVSPRIGGRTYQWGMPFPEQNEQGNNARQLMGEASFTNFGWINNLRVRSVTFHTQFQAAIGGQANNRNHQLMTNTAIATAPRMDQSGKPDELKKPILYYRRANDGDASYHIEDGDYLKLRTLSATLQLNRGQVQRLGLTGLGIHNLTLGLIGRNIFTITTYEGFDPEQALDLATRINADAGGYPPTRSLTAEVTVTF